MAVRIGSAAVEQVRQYIQQCGGEWIAAAAPDLPTALRGRLNTADPPRGIVLVGSQEVVPSRTLDVLPPELRGVSRRDADRMTVWSDDDYADRDHDGVPEVPISRVPDFADAAVLLRALSASLPALPASKAGIRNVNRSFADGVYSRLPGTETIRLCEPAKPPINLRNDLVYFMLHGTWKDVSRFKGESADDIDPYPEALHAQDIPDPCPPVVFSGCCYGALTLNKRARDVGAQDSVESVPVETSIALTCVARGANAFVGCTGVHYSPVRPDFHYLSEPFHRFFFEEMLAGSPPALALFRAKLRYASGMPFRGREASPVELAAEHKILRQFTCLGVGW